MVPNAGIRFELSFTTVVRRAGTVVGFQRVLNRSRAMLLADKCLRLVVVNICTQRLRLFRHSACRCSLCTLFLHNVI